VPGIKVTPVKLFALIVLTLAVVAPLLLAANLFVKAPSADLAASRGAEKYVLKRLGQNPAGDYNPIEVPQNGTAIGQVEFLSVGREDPPANNLGLFVKKPDIRQADLPDDYIYNFPQDDAWGSVFRDANTWKTAQARYYQAATAQVTGYRDYNGQSRPVYRFAVTFNGNDCQLPFARAGDSGELITCYPQPAPGDFSYPDPGRDVLLFREDFGVALIDSREWVPGLDGEAEVWWPLRIKPKYDTLPPSPPSTQLPPPGPSDVIVFAAHPDDEALGCAGVIYEARKAGKDVKIVVMTNGDALSLNHPLESIEYGLRRQGETVAAMAALGVAKDDIFFLGYPDSGWSKSAGGETYRSDHTNKTETYGDSANSYGGKADYHCLRTPGCQHAPYAPLSVVDDIKDILTRYPPAEIYVHHNVDRNYDHKLTYRAVRQAMQELGLSITVYKYLVHAPLSGNERSWPNPSCSEETNNCADKEYRYRPGEPFDIQKFQHVPDLAAPSVLRPSNITGSAKREVIEHYASQLVKDIKRGIPYGYGYLISFAKDEELFWAE
jgi:LmbE family N-acetylglucosaminyl deacetylase